jgi:DNA-binding CsgD family transcriptional regulator
MRNIKAIREGRMTLPSLTAKEIELLRYCIEDLTYLEIAQRMKTSAKSIEGYRNKLFQKLGTKTRTGLAMFAVRYGYVPVDTGILPRFF